MNSSNFTTSAVTGTRLFNEPMRDWIARISSRPPWATLLAAGVFLFVALGGAEAAEAGHAARPARGSCRAVTICSATSSGGRACIVDQQVIAGVEEVAGRVHSVVVLGIQQVGE